jgi:hypothetical protein
MLLCSFITGLLLYAPKRTSAHMENYLIQTLSASGTPGASGDADGQS